MDPVFVNNTWRTYQGFFLTSGRDATGELAVFNKTTELLLAAFKDSQIRSANLVTADSKNLALVEDIVNEVLETIGPLAAEQGVSPNGLVARTWFTASACIGAYHEKIKRAMDREGRNDSRGGEARGGEARGEARDGSRGRPREARPTYEEPRYYPQYSQGQYYAGGAPQSGYEIYSSGVGPQGGGHGAGGGHGGGGYRRAHGRFGGRGRFDESRSR